MTKKMKNPLNRRLPRELKSEFGKYLVIFLFFIMVISLVSGFLVADTSLNTAHLDAFDKYTIEAGNFAYAEEASDDAVAAIEKDDGTGRFAVGWGRHGVRRRTAGRNGHGAEQGH